jgi:hypothetical protein
LGGKRIGGEDDDDNATHNFNDQNPKPVESGHGGPPMVVPAIKDLATAMPRPQPGVAGPCRPVLRNPAKAVFR